MNLKVLPLENAAMDLRDIAALDDLAHSAAWRFLLDRLDRMDQRAMTSLLAAQDILAVARLQTEVATIEVLRGLPRVLMTEARQRLLAKGKS